MKETYDYKDLWSNLSGELQWNNRNFHHLIRSLPWRFLSVKKQVIAYLFCLELAICTFMTIEVVLWTFFWYLKFYWTFLQSTVQTRQDIIVTTQHNPLTRHAPKIMAASWIEDDYKKGDYSLKLIRSPRRRPHHWLHRIPSYWQSLMQQWRRNRQPDDPQVSESVGVAFTFLI